jgi:hypothetical protein
MLPFLSVAQHESGSTQAIFWSVTVLSNNSSSQCNLTAQIEPAQDKMPLDEQSAKIYHILA